VNRFRLRVTTANPRRVAMVVAMVTLLSGCLATQVSPPSGAAPLRYRDHVFADMTITHDLVYGSAPDLNGVPVTLTLDLYEPAGDTAAARPVVIAVPGGGFVTGDKSLPGWVTYTVDPLVQRGFVVASINYRLLASSPCIGTPVPTSECATAAAAGIHDGQAVVRWLRANATTYRIDTGRIAIEGVSSGGIVATGVGVMSDQVGESGNPGYSSRVAAWFSVAGGLPGGEFVGSSDPPGYLMSGSADTVVPHQWSVDTANALDNARVFAVLYTEAGAGHVVPPIELLASQSSNFYYDTLKLAQAQH